MFHDTAGPEDLTDGIIGCGIRVQASGYRLDTSRRVPVIYRGEDVGATFCPDLIVNDTIVVELKAVEKRAPVHTTQVITYLKLTGLPVGLLMNFHVDWLKNGARRIVRPDLYVRTIDRDTQK